MASGAGGWFRRKVPRLSGTLHIRDVTGHELVVPLRGRASVLTAGGTGLRGYGEVWAVHTTAGSPTAETRLMIVYGHGDVEGERMSGLCAAGETIELDGVRFTWRAPSLPSASTRVPQPRPPAGNVPRHLERPARRAGVDR
ncbi:hypothetical protein GCM10010112_58000 [Actinoplanes lobatus]|uniref:Uncharacterized protein n=1 Tax=Actinoplanes lobatus TaxID=113568 RepID=A0A7W7MLS6_9ACTN|nr:hypothetical protein [Actinoplanes lobatus]MBB4754848.1 hypothetical protein [Actinoplanes lobatus]GGN81488.1 hypothetical protein GCM10010112_58000 [Actinoplanes lobatus]GIE46276.1 hypothetical protein Alo02nite_91740 [Actinoplanes lobatus]